MTTFKAERWPAADPIMEGDPRWKGSDCAYSIDVGNDRSLWVFGDTFVGPAEQDRRDAEMVNNTLGLQEGRDPTTATMTFAWSGPAERPASYFAPVEGGFLWPGPPAVVEGRVLVTASRVRLTGAPPPWGFEHVGETALACDNIGGPLEDWRFHPVPLPVNSYGIRIGMGASCNHGEHVLRFAPGGTLARWSFESVLGGDLGAPEWWSGADGRGGWHHAENMKGEPTVVLPGAPDEFTVHFDSSLNEWIALDAVDIDNTVIQVRTAPRPEGPWSAPQVVFRPDESDRPDVIGYGAKAHPQLAGPGLVFTYLTNHHQGQPGIDTSIYWPRFVALNPADQPPARRRVS